MMFLTVRNGSSLARKQIESGLAMIIKQRGKPGQVWAKNSYWGTRLNKWISSVLWMAVIVSLLMIWLILLVLFARLQWSSVNQVVCCVRERIIRLAKRVFAFASHGVFSKNANDNISKSVLEQVIVLNTVPLSVASRENEKIITVWCSLCCDGLVVRGSSFGRLHSCHSSEAICFSDLWWVRIWWIVDVKVCLCLHFYGCGFGLNETKVFITKWAYQYNRNLQGFLTYDQHLWRRSRTSLWYDSSGTRGCLGEWER